LRWAPGFFGGLFIRPSTGIRNQKLTLVVETPEGEITGSSISSMRVTMGPGLFMDSPSIGVAFVGEAACVEVAPGRYLFALVSNGAGWASDTFAPVAV
jgi:hypothetical protein